ncbi:hypothetical protein FRB96_000431 [Tulasnella sp. 330]|nr:hypothetical protein FRB96_000431 [Tulasnella sp. 330]
MPESWKERRVKAAVQKRKQQTPTSPTTTDADKVVEEEAPVKGKAPENKRASRKLTEKKVALTDAQKKATPPPSSRRAAPALDDLFAGNNTETTTPGTLSVRVDGLCGTEGKSTVGLSPSLMM